MQQAIHHTALFLHILIGSASLIIFWLPLMVKKGSPNHIRFGRWFTKAMYTVSISGMVMTSMILLDPIALRFSDQPLSPEQMVQIATQQRIMAGFLLMLSVLVFTNVKQSILVLTAKADRRQLKTPVHLITIGLLGLLGLVMLTIGMTQQILLFQIFALLCVANSIACFHYIFKKELKKREWIIAHLGNIVGAGIGAYTAFFAFGGRRFFADILTGQLQIVPWVLPGVVGVFLTVYFSRKYRQQYRVS